MSIHVADPRRAVGLVLAIVFIVVAVIVLSAVTAGEPVPIGRS